MSKEKEYVFSGKVVRCTWNTPDFRIYALEVDKEKYPNIKRNKYNNVSILGDLSELTKGVEYEIRAVEKPSKYGMSYKVLNIRRNIPKTPEDMYLFLSEILTHNQAQVLYDTYPDIVQRVKENRLDDIDLNKLKGIKEYTFNNIKRKIEENFCLSDLVVEFQGFFSLSIIKKIYNKYTSIDKVKYNLKKDPYKCLCSLARVGFKTADEILLKIEKISKENIEQGKEPIIEFETDLRSSPQRCLACLIYLLEQNEDEGHTKMNLADLRAACLKLVPACSDHFTTVIKSDYIYYNKKTMDVALRGTYQTEYEIAKTILRYLHFNKNVWNYNIEKYRNVNGVPLSDEQMQALSNVCKYTISILNGSAGCGKSFSTQAIINMLKDNDKTFRLLSPTGKAAKVLSDYTGEIAETIHKGLGYIPKRDKNCWTFCAENKLDCDIVIIDEFSMVDIQLFSRVIDAIDLSKTKLLMIGDNAQLPSVSCGNLLHDFMATKKIPTVTLTKVFRYGEGGLMKIATDVRCSKVYLNNSMKSRMTTFGDNKDYTFVDLPSDTIPKNAVALYKKLMDKGYKIEDIQVLTAQNKGDCGTIVLNNMIQRVANPNYGSSSCIKVGDTAFYKGDLVIQKANNYKALYYFEYFSETDKIRALRYPDKHPSTFIANGETGIVKDVKREYIVIDFDGTVVYYGKESINMISLGYAITIHKSQGSSIRVVILCTPQSHIYMLNSNLLYVGLTRMKELAYHLGTMSSINKAIEKKANLIRHTFMQQFLTDTSEAEYIEDESSDSKNNNTQEQDDLDALFQGYFDNYNEYNIEPLFDYQASNY